jgi:hypothetical protein
MPPVLRCGEVSQPNDVKGQSRHVARASGASGLSLTADILLHRTSRRGGPGCVKTSVREDLVEFNKFPYLLTRMIAASYHTQNIK